MTDTERQIDRQTRMRVEQVEQRKTGSENTNEGAEVEGRDLSRRYQRLDRQSRAGAVRDSRRSSVRTIGKEAGGAPGAANGSERRRSKAKQMK